MAERKLWDTRVPEDMVLLARNVSEYEHNDPDVINELYNALNRGITDSEGVPMSPIKHQCSYDIATRQHVYDVYMILRTKGGWRD